MKLKTEKIKEVLLRHKVAVSAVLLIFLVWLFCLPSPIFEEPTSTVVESREGILLGARIARDGQWRFPAKDTIPHRFEEAILQFEDEFFYWHPGFNPISMTKAAWDNLRGRKRRGASTLTQQVVRLSRKNQGRTYFEKLIELFLATRLEAGYSKKEILNLYANHAPFGGNVVGLETASWRYFGIPAEELSWAQSAALAVLPNAPSLIYPGKNETIFRQKRDRLLFKLLKKKIIDSLSYELALLEALPGKPLPLPDAALHFTERIKKEKEGERVKSTLNASLQTQLNQITADHHFRLKQNQIHNLSILVLDVHTREIIGYVGNSPTEIEHGKFVDVINRPRSTGSILKPLLFASAMHAGELLPKTLLPDIPTTVNGYSPQNFERKFHGAVTAGAALSRSLNVPAVRLLKDFGLQRFYSQVQKMGMNHIDQRADHYGLTLILGGAESSLLEVTQVYAGLAASLNTYTANSSQYRESEFLAPVSELGSRLDFGEFRFDPPVVGAGAIYKTFESLRESNRPNADESWSFYQDARPIAWKTGTSYGFKDAWAVGVTPDYAIGVWVGNADGEGRPGLTGILAAAPVLFDVLKELPAKKEWFDMPYDDLIKAQVCTRSGHLAGIYCEESREEWIPALGNRTAVCPYHQPVFLNSSGTYRVNSSCYPLEEMRSQNWFSLPPVMAHYFAPLNPDYRVLPPLAPGCVGEEDPLMDFIYPRKNEVVILPRDFDEQVNEVVFRLAHRNPETTVYWYIDEKFIHKTQTFHEIALVIEPGEYWLSATDQEGNSIRERITVIDSKKK